MSEKRSILSALDAESLRIVESFEDAWEHGRPNLVDFLARHPQRPDCLLLELAAIDLENRIKRGEAAHPREYAAEFPQLASGSCLAELSAVRARFLDGDAEIDTTTSLQSRRSRGERDPILGVDVGGVTIVRLISEGGMGRVYEGRQDRPRRPVAVKFVKTQLVSESMHRRFEYEAQMLGRLRHPGIAQIFTVGTYEVEGRDVPYFVMEYVPNAKPLTRFADERRLSTHERLELFRKVCDAVAHGHQKGIIHRDLKPSNVLVDSSGHPKVIDFGVARSTDSDMALTTMQTDVGALIGTLQYMSPEQFDADPHDLDVRLDVYALGVILYELLTGKPPYDVRHRAIFEVARVVREEEPTPMSTLDKTLRRDVALIAGKCLQKDRNRRYASAAELAGDVTRYLAGEPVTAAPPRFWDAVVRIARRHRAAALAVVGVAVSLVVAILAISIFAARTEFARAREQVAKEEAVGARSETQALATDFRHRLSKQYVLKGQEALADDDRSLALLWFTKALTLDEGDPEREPRHRLRIAQTRQRMPHLVALRRHAAPISCLQQSADGRRILTASYDGTARIWDFRTGDQVGETLEHNGIVYQAMFSPDGKYVATGCGDGTARLWDAHTGMPVGAPMVHGSRVGWVRFSPDGTTLATSCGRPSDFFTPPPGVDVTVDKEPVAGEISGGIWEVPSCSRRRQVTLPGGPIAWHPHGRVVACRTSFIDAETGLEARPGLPQRQVVIAVHYADENHLVIRSPMGGECSVWDLRASALRLDNIRCDGLGGDGFQNVAMGRIVNDTTFVAGRQSWDLSTGRLEKTDGDWPTNREIVVAGRSYLVQSRPGQGARLYGVEDDSIVSPTLWYGGSLLPVVVSPDRRFMAFVDYLSRDVVQIFDLAGTGADADVVVPVLGQENTLRHSSKPILVTGQDGTVVRRLAHGVPDDRAGLWKSLETSDGRVIITAGGDRRIRFWDSRTGLPIRVPVEVAGIPADIALAADDTVLLATVRMVGGENYQIHGWHMHDGRPCWEPIGATYRGSTLAVSPSGRYFSRESGQHRVEVWEATSGMRVFEGTPHAYWVGRPRFSPDDDFVVFPGADGMVSMWSIPDGRRIHALQLGEGAWDCAVTQDGRSIAISDMTGKIHLFDCKSGERRANWAVGARETLGYSKDDKTLIGTTAKAWATLVDSSTGELMGPVIPVPGLRSATFSDTGKSFHVDGDLRQTWRFEPELLGIQELADYAVAVSGREINDAGVVCLADVERRVRLFEDYAKRHASNRSVSNARVTSWRLHGLHQLFNGPRGSGNRGILGDIGTFHVSNVLRWKEGSGLAGEAAAIVDDLLEENPTDIGLLTYAPVFVAAGRPRDAVAALTRRILSVPVDSAEWRLFEELVDRHGAQDQVLAVLAEAPNRHPTTAVTLQVEGLMSLQRGDATAAIDLLSRSCDAGATGQVYSYRASAYALQESWPQAEADFHRLLAIEPNDFPALRGLMAVYAATGNMAGWHRVVSDAYSRICSDAALWGGLPKEVAKVVGLMPITGADGFTSRQLVGEYAPFASQHLDDPEYRVGLAIAYLRDGQFEQVLQTLAVEGPVEGGVLASLVLSLAHWHLGHHDIARSAAEAAQRSVRDADVSRAWPDWRDRIEVMHVLREVEAALKEPQADQVQPPP